MSEELDIEQPAQLELYLRGREHIGVQEHPMIEVLTGGVSNKTVLVSRENGDAIVVKQALAKLRVQVDWFSSPERIHREALGLRWLNQIAPSGTVTPFLFEDFEHHLLGMAAVPMPHENWKRMLLEGRLETDHVLQFARLLGTMHREGALRINEIEPMFGDRGFFESLRLEPYYVYTASQVPESRAFLSALVAETRSRRDTVVHGDYSPKNVLVHHGRLVLLDHEVIHLGDPGFDLGFSMTHLLSKAHHVEGRRAAFGAAVIDFWNCYEKIIGDVRWADEIEERVVRHTLGCMLARVRGRSPLEYLSDGERTRQAAAVTSLMSKVPVTVTALTDQFLAKIGELEAGRETK